MFAAGGGFGISFPKPGGDGRVAFDAGCGFSCGFASPGEGEGVCLSSGRTAVREVALLLDAAVGSNVGREAFPLPSLPAFPVLPGLGGCLCSLLGGGGVLQSSVGCEGAVVFVGNVTFIGCGGDSTAGGVGSSIVWIAVTVVISAPPTYDNTELASCEMSYIAAEGSPYGVGNDCGNQNCVNHRWRWRRHHSLLRGGRRSRRLNSPN